MNSRGERYANPPAADRARRGTGGMGARRAADYNAPGIAGVVFQNTALTRSLADRVVGFLTARLSRGGPASDILRCAPGP